VVNHSVFYDASDDGWQWQQPEHVQMICTSLQIANYTSTPITQFFYTPDAPPATQPTVSKHWGHIQDTDPERTQQHLWLNCYRYCCQTGI